MVAQKSLTYSSIRKYFPFHMRNEKQSWTQKWPTNKKNKQKTQKQRGGSFAGDAGLACAMADVDCVFREEFSPIDSMLKSTKRCKATVLFMTTVREQLLAV